jgi:hypothetical protein
MASGRPIVAIGPLGSDFSDIILQTNTGLFFDYGQKDALKKAIVNSYESFLQGRLNVNAIGLETYSRKKLTEHLSHIVHQSKLENLNS